MNIDTVKNNMKEYETENVRVRFIEPVKETDWIPVLRRAGIRPLQESGEVKQKIVNYFKNYRLFVS